LIFTLFSPTTKPSALNGQQLKIIFHLPFTQLLVNFPFSPEDTNQWQRKKKVANKATHQQAEMWEPGVFGPGPLCHADNLLPIFCQFFFFVFFLVRCELLRWFAFNYAAIEKFTTCTTISVSVHFFAPRIGWGKGLGFRPADNRF